MRAPRLRTAEAWAYGLVASAYLLVVSGRPLVMPPESGYDDGLFLRAARQIASGHWLGPYDQLTLAKEPGFPVFLALGYTVGLPYGLAVCLVYAGAAWFMCRALRGTGLSRAGRLLLFAALLFAPPLASSATTFVERDFFYAGLSLALFAAIVRAGTAQGPPAPGWRAAGLAGLLAGCVWLTREEGVWFVPGAAAFAVIAVARSPKGQALGAAKRWAFAAAVAAASVLAVGLVNRAAYGRFELAEIKSGPFQSAMVALQRAAYPDWRAYVPVPAAARARIYAQSPSFARLKPLLDPAAGSPNAWQAIGCDAQPDTCGDFGGSYMMWALRAAASGLGLHGSPAEADSFYAGLAREVDGACRDGRLACAPWMPPLIPPVTRAQVRAFPETLLRTAERVAMMDGPEDGWIATGPPRGLDRAAAELVGATPYGPGRIVAIAGDVRGPAAPSLTMSPVDTARVLAFTPPAAGGSRFSAVVGCLTEPCAVRFGGADGPDTDLPLAPASALPDIPSDAGSVTGVTVSSTGYTLKARFTNAFNRALPRLSRAYAAFVLLGTACFLALAAHHALRRSLSPRFAVALALAVAVASRIAVVALVDASSFPAINDAYLAPAFPLCIAAALISIEAAAAELRRRWTRKRGAGGPRDGSRSDGTA